MLAVGVQVFDGDSGRQERLQREDVHRRRPAADEPSLDLLIGGLTAEELRDLGGAEVVLYEALDCGRLFGTHGSAWYTTKTCVATITCVDTSFCCGNLLA